MRVAYLIGKLDGYENVTEVKLSKDDRYSYLRYNPRCLHESLRGQNSHPGSLGMTCLLESPPLPQPQESLKETLGCYQEGWEFHQNALDAFFL